TPRSGRAWSNLEAKAYPSIPSGELVAKLLSIRHGLRILVARVLELLERALDGVVHVAVAALLLDVEIEHLAVEVELHAAERRRALAVEDLRILPAREHVLHRVLEVRIALVDVGVAELVLVELARLDGRLADRRAVVGDRRRRAVLVVVGLVLRLVVRLL